MNWIIAGLAFVTFLSTLIGGIVAIKLRRILPYFFAFSAGCLIAVTFFDILPESIELSQSVNLPINYLMITVVSSFLFYTILEKYFLTHHIHDEDYEAHGHIMGPVGAGGLVVHSFLDGAAIGAAYQVNATVGLIVALAVIFHDFTDGINTVTIMLKNKQHIGLATVFLFMDAIAPVLGVISTSVISISQTILSLILAAFAGEFLYLGASHMLPETHKHSAWKMILSLILGVLLIFALTSILQSEISGQI